MSEASLSSCLRRVRRAIGQTRSGPILIETLHRRGYRFVAEVMIEESTPIAPEAKAEPLTFSVSGLPGVSPEALEAVLPPSDLEPALTSEFPALAREEVATPKQGAAGSARDTTVSAQGGNRTPAVDSAELHLDS